jgi:hypothetical protein
VGICKSQANSPFILRLKRVWGLVKCPKPLSLEVQGLLTRLSEAATMVSSLVFLPTILSLFNLSSKQLWA